LEEALLHVPASRLINAEPSLAPPVGTEVLLGGGFVEAHVGRGIWHTVAAGDELR
jgi:hypothetical protein